jgi:hypothetical protein
MEHKLSPSLGFMLGRVMAYGGFDVGPPHAIVPRVP